MKPEKKLINYTRHYNEKKLFKKLKHISGTLSVNLLYYILILFYLISDEDVPFKTRIVFIAALGYLILPTDLIADIIPGLGFTDDAALIAYAISSASNYVSPELREKAMKTLIRLVGQEKAESVKFKNII